jgi:hypothetical protein
LPFTGAKQKANMPVTAAELAIYTETFNRLVAPFLGSDHAAPARTATLSLIAGWTFIEILSPSANTTSEDLGTPPPVGAAYPSWSSALIGMVDRALCVAWERVKKRHPALLQGADEDRLTDQLKTELVAMRRRNEPAGFNANLFGVPTRDSKLRDATGESMTIGSQFGCSHAPQWRCNRREPWHRISPKPGMCAVRQMAQRSAKLRCAFSGYSAESVFA